MQEDKATYQRHRDKNNYFFPLMAKPELILQLGHVGRLGVLAHGSRIQSRRRVNVSLRLITVVVTGRICQEEKKKNLTESKQTSVCWL